MSAEGTAGEAEEVMAALADLGVRRRHSAKLALVGLRDRAASDDPKMARVWNALAAAVAGIEDHERAVLEEIETRFFGVADTSIDDA